MLEPSTFFIEAKSVPEDTQPIWIITEHQPDNGALRWLGRYVFDSHATAIEWVLARFSQRSIMLLQPVSSDAASALAATDALDSVDCYETAG
jgi:hypothetical protein